MKRINTLKNKKGMALLTVMLIFFVLSILLAGLVSVTNSNLKQSVVTKNHTAAFYAAEAGIIYTTNNFQKKINELISNSTNSSDFFNQLNTYILGFNNKETFLDKNNNEETRFHLNIDIQKDKDDLSIYKFTSEGFVGNLSRKLEVLYNLTYVPGDLGNGFLLSNAVLVFGESTEKRAFELKDGFISGAPLAVLSSKNDSIWFRSASVLGVDKILLLDKSKYLTSITLDGFNNPGSTTWLERLNYLVKDDDEISSIPLFEKPIIVIPSYEQLSGKKKSSLPKLPENYAGGVTSNGSIVKDRWYPLVTNYKIPNTSNWYYVPTFKINHNYIYTIDVGDTDKFLVVDNFNLDGILQLTGKGKLTIFVTGADFPLNTSSSTLDSKISFKSTDSIYVGNKTDPDKFLVYVEPIFVEINVGTKKDPIIVKSQIEVKIESSSIYSMSLMASNLNVSIGGSAQFLGYIVTGGEKVNYYGNTSTLLDTFIYAPNADVVLSGTTKIFGAVISDTFSMSGGGSEVVYNPDIMDNFPFEIFNPYMGGDGSDKPNYILDKGKTIEK